MTVNVTDWLDSVQRQAPGADEGLITAVTLQAIIEFAKDAKVHHFTFVKADTEADTATYDLTLPANTRLHEVEAVFYDGLPLKLEDPDMLQELHKTFLADTGTPTNFYMDDDDTVHLYPIPVADDKILRVVGYVAPAEGSTTVDDRYWNHYRQEIANLATATLLEMPQGPARPWADANRALHYRALYDDRLSRILSDGPKNQHATKRRRAQPGFRW